MSGYKISVTKQTKPNGEFMVVAGHIWNRDYFQEVVELRKAIGSSNETIRCNSSSCLFGDFSIIKAYSDCLAKVLEIIQGEYVGDSSTTYG